MRDEALLVPTLMLFQVTNSPIYIRGNYKVTNSLIYVQEVVTVYVFNFDEILKNISKFN